MINSKQRNRETQQRAYQQQGQLQAMGRQTFIGTPGNVIQGGAAWSGPSQFPDLPDAVTMTAVNPVSKGKQYTQLFGAGLGAMACSELPVISPLCMQAGNDLGGLVADEAPVAWDWIKGAAGSVDHFFKTNF